MITLIEVHAVKIILISLLTLEVYSMNAFMRLALEDCKREIEVYFDDVSVKDQADKAMENYTEYLPLNKINSSAMGYYKSFRDFLRPGSIQLPEDFLGLTPADGSLDWLRFIYGNDKFQIVQSAFFKHRPGDLLSTNSIYMIPLDVMAVQSPDFTVPFRSADCSEWMNRRFGSFAFFRGSTAFYKYRMVVSQNQIPGRFNQENIYEDCHIPIENLYDIVRYFWHIMENYKVETNGFSDPTMYCFSISSQMSSNR